MRSLSLLAAVAFSALAFVSYAPTVPPAAQPAASTNGPLSLFVSPKGNDSNLCLFFDSPCKSFNGALARIPKVVNDPVTITAAPGDYYSALPLADGGAPNLAELNGLIDAEGFVGGAGGSIVVQGATNQLAFTLTTIDGGDLAGTYPSNGFLQIAPNQSFTAYAVDAGFAYSDGGMITNALAGTFATMVAGPNAGATFPITSNDLTTISFVTHSVTGGTAPSSPTASNTIQITSNATHLHPYATNQTNTSTAYTHSVIYVAGISGSTIFERQPNAPAIPFIVPQPALLTFKNLDIEQDPNGHLFWGAIQQNSSSLVDFEQITFGFTYPNNTINSNAFYILNATGPTEVGASYLASIYGFPSVFVLNTKFLSSGTAYNMKCGLFAFTHSSAVVESSFIKSAACVNLAPIQVDFGSSLYLVGANRYSGNQSGPDIAISHNSNATIQWMNWATDGGAGLATCISGGNLTVESNTFNGSNNLFSANAGVNWFSLSDYGAADAGPGILGLCGAGTGCCVSNQ